MLKRIEEFLHYLSAERGSPRNTIEAYRNDLNGLVKFTEKLNNTVEHGNSISRELIINYLAELNQREYAKSTVARKIAVLKSFCTYLIDVGDLKSNPTSNLNSPRPQKTIPKPLSPQHIDLLLSQPLQLDTPESTRDAAMLELMYATGIRVTELVSLNLDSLHIKPHPAYIRCVGKGAKERTIPVHEKAVEALNRYLDQGRNILLKARLQQALFVNRRGERLTRQGFWLILKNYARLAGIESHVTPHTLRHSFATHLLRGGASIRDVQELLGHANVSTTQIYTQLVDQHLREVYENVHPRAI